MHRNATTRTAGQQHDSALQGRQRLLLPACVLRNCLEVTRDIRIWFVLSWNLISNKKNTMQLSQWGCVCVQLQTGGVRGSVHCITVITNRWCSRCPMESCMDGVVAMQDMHGSDGALCMDASMQVGQCRCTWPCHITASS